MVFLVRGNRMEYLTSPEMSEKWGISSRRISLLCAQDRIEGAIKKGKYFLDYQYIDIDEEKIRYSILHS